MKELIFGGIKKIITNVDWILLGTIVPIMVVGLVTMSSFTDANYFFDKQLISIVLAVTAFFILSTVDFRFLRRTSVIVSLFVGGIVLLLIIGLLGEITQGAQGWLYFGGFAFQPAEPMKIVLILLLAKYFSRRHIEIANVRHIIISGLYASIPIAIIITYPDFGSVLILAAIWFGMVLVSGISKKHLFAVFAISTIAFSGLWMYGFKDYQKDRIISFLHPLANVQGSGYNAYQSTIAVGSGQITGKGIGYGTQSRLKFLPEYQTDFIFAAYAEEWGFVGAVGLIILFGVVLWRVLANALAGATNFEVLYGIGLAILFSAHLIINIGMNIGLMPITGITIPFMSYGGSHLLTEFIGLGILMGMGQYRRRSERVLANHDVSDITL